MITATKKEKWPASDHAISTSSTRKEEVPAPSGEPERLAGRSRGEGGDGL